ncbi:hypothetical protein DFJ77DRAFT_314824 [Powellomyces hirtus]|nr:hypothetical protein DFJ77DRAFT_314824 [Powellomyces hirtus]
MASTTLGRSKDDSSRVVQVANDPGARRHRRNSTGTLGSITSEQASNPYVGGYSTMTFSPPNRQDDRTPITAELLQYLASTQKHMVEWAASAGLPADRFADPHRGFLPSFASSLAAEPPKPSRTNLDHRAQLQAYQEQQKQLEHQYMLQQMQQLEQDGDGSEQTLQTGGAKSSAGSLDGDRTAPSPHPTPSLSSGTSSRIGKGRNRVRLPAVNPHAIRTARNSLELPPVGRQNEELYSSIHHPASAYPSVDTQRSFPNLNDKYAHATRANGQHVRQESDETLVADPGFDDPDMYSAYEFLNSSRLNTALHSQSRKSHDAQVATEISHLVDKFPLPPNDAAGKAFALEQYQIMQAWGQRKKGRQAKRGGIVTTPLPNSPTNGNTSPGPAGGPQPTSLPTITHSLTPPATPPKSSRKPKTVDEWLAMTTGISVDTISENTTAKGVQGSEGSLRPKHMKKLSTVMNDWKKSRFQGQMDQSEVGDNNPNASSSHVDSFMESTQTGSSIAQEENVLPAEKQALNKAVLNEILLDYTITVNRLREPALDSQRAVLRLRKTRSSICLSSQAQAQAGSFLPSTPPSPPPEPTPLPVPVLERAPVVPSNTIPVPKTKVEALTNYANMMNRMARPSLDIQRATFRRPVVIEMPAKPSPYYVNYTSDLVQLHPRNAKDSIGSSSGRSVIRRFLGMGSDTALDADSTKPNAPDSNMADVKENGAEDGDINASSHHQPLAETAKGKGPAKGERQSFLVLKRKISRSSLTGANSGQSRKATAPKENVRSIFNKSKRAPASTPPQPQQPTQPVQQKPQFGNRTTSPRATTDDTAQKFTLDLPAISEANGVVSASGNATSATHIDGTPSISDESSCDDDDDAAAEVGKNGCGGPTPSPRTDSLGAVPALALPSIAANHPMGESTPVSPVPDPEDATASIARRTLPRTGSDRVPSNKQHIRTSLQLTREGVPFQMPKRGHRAAPPRVMNLFQKFRPSDASTAASPTSSLSS